jgi:phosphoserine phosphatase RsbU/P
MSASPKVNPARFALLCLLFAGAVAFQLTVSGMIWKDSHDAHGAMQWNTFASLLNLQLITPFACLILGFYVAAVRIWDPKAWLLMGVLLSFSLVSDGTDVHDRVMDWDTPLKHAALIYRSAITNIWPIFFLFFSIYFPDRADFDRRRPWLKWIVVAPSLAVYLLVVLSRVANNEHMVVPLLKHRRGLALDIVRIYSLLVLSLAILLWKFAVSRDHDDRRRLKVLFAGIVVSVVPAYILDWIAHHMMHVMPPPWVELLVYTLVILFPITLAYVTVVQRAMDVRVILRHSLQYALARRGLAVLHVVTSIAVILLIAIFSNSMRFGTRVTVTAIGVGLISLVGFGSRQLAGWIDRRFFREAYDREQVLARLADSVGSIVELSPLLNTLAARLSEAMHISEVAVFLCEQNLFRMAHAVGYSQVPNVEFEDKSSTIGELQREKRPLAVYLDDPYSWAAQVDTKEQEELAKLGSQLLLPLSRRDELLGFVSLGPRFAEAPYAPSDVNLLHSVAQQTALAVENSRLTSTIALETAAREVIRTELSIAREVQQRLLPQAFPTLRGANCFAACRPAQEVGGDYFDFLELADGVLGMAIGDISGKGIPASLLMASLQASLRGQTLVGGGPLETLIGNVNRLVYGASPVNRYATFFYCQYQAEKKTLTYVNAGHNAPMLLSKSDRTVSVQRLEAGGPPIGLLPMASYESGRVQMQPGDLLVLYTDGISEAMNLSEEEWGEDRMIKTLSQLDGKPAKTIVQEIFSAADDFAGTAPQHDDMTVLVFALSA